MIAALLNATLSAEASQRRASGLVDAIYDDLGIFDASPAITRVSGGEAGDCREQLLAEAALLESGPAREQQTVGGVQSGAPMNLNINSI